jgi:hypothetical protein
MAQIHKVSGVSTVIGSDNGYEYVQYHRTKVVKWNEREIILDSGGWFSPTTKNRMNQTSSQFKLGFSVYQKKGQWFVFYKDQDIPFEGNKVTLYRMSPRFETGCENCVYLGTYEYYDLYYCTGGKHLIAKYGNDPEDYKGVYVFSERPDSLSNLPEFIEAKRLAVEKGFINE